MTKEKNKKIISASVTIAFHVILLVILSLLSLKFFPEDKLEDGVPVMLGNVPDASGDSAGELSTPEEDTPEPATTEEEVDVEESIPEPAKPEPQKPAPQKEPLITQDNEESIKVEKARKEEAERKRKAEEARIAEEKRKAAEEARIAEEKRKAEEARIAEERRKAAEEAERKRKEEERKKREAAEKASSKVSGAFGSAKSNGNNGQTTGEGLQGSPDGNSNTGATTGVGGTGNNPIAKVGSRRPIYTPRPNYTDPKGSGDVVVAITVNKSGKVISAKIQSTTATAPLNEEALRKAKMSTFSPGASDTESGTITYKFRLK